MVDTKIICDMRYTLCEYAGLRDWQEFRVARLALSDLLEEQGRSLEAAVTRAEWAETGRRSKIPIWIVRFPEIPDKAMSRRAGLLLMCVNREPVLHFAAGTLKAQRWQLTTDGYGGIVFSWMENRQTMHWYDEGAVRNGFWSLWE